MTSYPLLTQDALERRLNGVAGWQSHLALTDTEWDQLIADIIEEESSFVAGQLDDEGVHLAEYGGTDELHAEYPDARRAMVRLCRASLNNIDSDGLESETVGDHSESYRPPIELREEVADELSGINGGGSTDDGFRSAVI